jgi:hypothetical protein
VTTIPIPHKTYDRVIDNDWDEVPVLVMFLNGTPAKDVIPFATWCGRVSGTKLRVRFPRKRGPIVHISRA